MTIEINQLIEKAQLPSSIEVVANLQDIISKGIASAHDFAEEIQSDAGLTARIMRLANSAFYGRGAIDNIEQAIVLVGEDDLIALIISTEIIEALHDKNNYFDMTQFWQESIFSAVSAKIIARRVARPKSRLFTSTLLRRVGWLSLWRAYPDIAAKIQTQQAVHSDKKSHIIELSELGFHHATLSAQLLEYWQLPKSVYEPIHYYLEPKMAEASYQQDAAIIHLAHQHMHNTFGLLEINWIGDDWLNAILGIPKEALIAEADMEVHAHFSRMQSMLLQRQQAA